MRSDGTELTILTDSTKNAGFPSWSPDARQLVYAIRRLTGDSTNDNPPAWSPDGEWIAFTSARGGFKDEAALHSFNPQSYGEIYVMRMDGSNARALTDNQFEDGTPTWIPTPSATSPRDAPRKPAP
jgi:TolB protein